MEIPKNLSDAARKHFADYFGRRPHRIVRSDSQQHRHTESMLYLFVAGRTDSPNEPHAELILDSEGRQVKVGVSRRNLFVPALPPIPAHVVGAASVTISPSVNELRLGECDKFEETITVTLPPEAAVAPADIYFLADNTGSMGPAIANVQAGAATIFASLSAFPGLQFGVGEYQDFDNAGDTSLAFQNRQSITNTSSPVTTAINSWTAFGGGDAPEAQFYALDQVAGSPAIGWRPGVKRIVVWLGDAPGHDPICKAASGLGYDITEPSVTFKLKTAGITVLAVSINDGSGDPAGLNDDPTNLLGSLNAAYGACGAPGGTPGQATHIAAATGGIVVNGVDPSAIVTTIINQLKALLTINNVHLQPVGGIVPFVTSITPPSYGPLPGDQPNVLTFDVKFSGDVEDCATRDRLFTGSIDVVVDNSVVAAKPTRITVPACKFTYGVKFICGTQSDCGCVCGPVRPGIYSTEINILNPKCKDAHIVKRVVPLVYAGATIGREPAIAKARATENIVLPSGGATMDDCCRISELLYGAVPGTTMPLTVGFLEIVSDEELHVTAVYTASDVHGNGLSVEVETVQGKLT